MYCSYSSRAASCNTRTSYAFQGLESIVSGQVYHLEYAQAAALPSHMPIYSQTSNSAGHTAAGGSREGYLSRIYHSPQRVFLNPQRPRTPFIAAAAEIAGFIKEAFAKTTLQELPDDIIITVAARESLQHAHPQFSKPSIAGLSLNGSRREIFVAAAGMDEVMLVIGHEIGHVLTPALGNGKAEEAKAFAFEMAWANAIFLHDIAGLRNSINAAAIAMKPAENGLHDTAFAFVKAAAMAGKEALQLHSELSSQQHEADIDSSDFTTASANSPAAYVPLASHHSRAYSSGGYRNKSSVQNVPWLQNFTWADLGTGVYGMYIPLTASIFMNERLLRTDLEQFHKTVGHEYVLHHVMQLPDGYVAKVMEEAIFWVKDNGENEDYKP
ncbi:hypothetical protein HYU17_05680 [Candidatus Woesearchaeota archaeon]|nr:hypothetical protein [Candidatus Woesearchaeota archaeon]